MSERREAQRALFREEPYESRLAIVFEVASTIDMDDFQITFSGPESLRKPYLARGLVVIEGLPIEFRAFHQTVFSSPHDEIDKKNINFLHDTVSFDEDENVTHPELWMSNWFLYAPEVPLSDFTIGLERDSKPVLLQKDERKKRILGLFGLEENLDSTELDLLIRGEIAKRADEYERLLVRLRLEPRLKGIYDAAVRIACNARVEELVPNGKIAAG